jgi:hypothetical protein
VLDGGPDLFGGMGGLDEEPEAGGVVVTAGAMMG